MRGSRPMTRRRRLSLLLIGGIALGLLLLGARPAGLGAQTSLTVALEAGWNNVAYQGETLPVDRALTSVLGDIESVWQWRAPQQEWVVAFTDRLSSASLRTLENGGAYWIRATRSVIWPLRAGVLFQTATLAVDRAGGTTLRLDIELADSGARRSRGLMFRESLPADAGMLFLFPADTGGGFWMRNTLVPLSIAFIGADGRIQEIRDMQPLDESLVTPADRYRWALEVNQGWFQTNDVRTGDGVRFSGH